MCPVARAFADPRARGAHLGPVDHPGRRGRARRPPDLDRDAVARRLADADRRRHRAHPGCRVGADELVRRDRQGRLVDRDVRSAPGERPRQPTARDRLAPHQARQRVRGASAAGWCRRRAPPGLPLDQLPGIAGVRAAPGGPDPWRRRPDPARCRGLPCGLPRRARHPGSRDLAERTRGRCRAAPAERHSGGRHGRRMSPATASSRPIRRWTRAPRTPASGSTPTSESIPSWTVRPSRTPTAASPRLAA